MLSKINSVMPVCNYSSKSKTQKNPSFGMVVKVKNIDWNILRNSSVELMDNAVATFEKQGKKVFTHYFPNGDCYIACERKDGSLLGKKLSKLMESPANEVQVRNVDMFNDEPYVSKGFRSNNQIPDDNFREMERSNEKTMIKSVFEK